MKTKILNSIVGLGMMGLSILPSSALAQDKHPCEKHYNNFAIRYNAETYTDAYQHWQYMVKSCEVIDECPCLNADVWDMGIYTMEVLAQEETDEKYQRVLVDSIYNAYETKLRLYEENDYDLSGYGLALSTYDHVNMRKKQYELLGRSLHIAEDPDYVTAEYFFTAAYNMFAKSDEGSDCGWLVEEYFKLSETVLAATGISEEPEEWTKVQARMDQLVENCLSCEQLVPMVTQKLLTLPSDCAEAEEDIKKYITLLDTKGCQDSEAFKTLAVKAYECNKTHESAYQLAVMYSNDGDKVKAIEYIKEAISLNSEKDMIGKYNYILAQTYSAMGNISSAAQYARNATSYNKKAWKYVADLYKSNTTCGSTGIARASVWWLASDYMEKAGFGADYYKNKYPTQRELFEETISIGSSYKVSCFGETTKVRAKDA